MENEELMFVSTNDIKSEVTEATDIIGKICEQIKDGGDIPREYSDKLFDDIQQVINDLMIIYAAQELNEKL